jgi:hypothetical protein
MALTHRRRVTVAAGPAGVGRLGPAATTVKGEVDARHPGVGPRLGHTAPDGDRRLQQTRLLIDVVVGPRDEYVRVMGVDGYGGFVLVVPRGQPRRAAHTDLTCRGRGLRPGRQRASRNGSEKKGTQHGNGDNTELPHDDTTSAWHESSKPDNATAATVRDCWLRG